MKPRPPSANQRRFPRRACRLPCEIHFGGEEHKGIALDVSARGLFVRTQLRLDPGTEVRLVLRPLDGEPIELLATVARKRVSHRSVEVVRLGGLGLELGSAPERYFQLVASLSREDA